MSPGDPEADRGPTVAGTAGGDEHSPDWSVILLDENEVRGEVTARWIEEGRRCVRVTDSAALLDGIDHTCTVACLRVARDGYDDLVRQVWERYPHVQILQLLGRADFSSLDRQGDEVLQEPYSKETLQETVGRLFARGLYALKLREYYQLRSYLVGRDEPVGPAVERTTERLRERLVDVEAEIDAIKGSIDGEDFEEILRSHRRRETELGTPSMDVAAETRSKYRPASCPNCGIAWGANHGGRLGSGCERVAALVWRCTGCSETLEVSPGEYDHIL